MFFIGCLMAILVLLIIVIVHEAGHFFVARYFGMQTPVVGLGLPFAGKHYVLGTWKDVEFRLHWLLFGAYVSIPEMDDETAKELDSFNIQLQSPPRQFPAWQRLLVSVAGPVANMILAFIILLASSFTLGMIDTSNSPESITVVKVTESATPSSAEFLQAGDIIVQINSEEINSLNKLKESLSQYRNKYIDLTVKRQDQLITNSVQVNKDGYLGISLSQKVKNAQYIPIEGTPIISQMQYSWNRFMDIFNLSIHSIKTLITAPFKVVLGADTGIKATELHGILEVTKDLANIFQVHIGLLIQSSALLSLYIGIINLVPMLPLDGGHIIFQLCEICGLKGNILNKLRNGYAMIGFIIILSLLVLVMFNDLRSIFFE